MNSPEFYLTADYQNYFKEISRSTQQVKEVIATIDISGGKPTLVKSSKISEHHSNL